MPTAVPPRASSHRCGNRLLDVRQSVVEKLHPAGDLLAERQRRRVHQVRPADLDDVLERLRPSAASVSRSLRTDGISRVAERLDGGDVHGRREDVVGRLAHVDVVVGVDLAAHPALAAQELAGAVGDHFVQVHVGLRAAAGLPDDERELVVVLAGDHFVGRGDDRLADRGVLELPEVEVDLGRRAA